MTYHLFINAPPNLYVDSMFLNVIDAVCVQINDIGQFYKEYLCYEYEHNYIYNFNVEITN